MNADERGLKTKHLHFSNPCSSVFIGGQEVYFSNLPIEERAIRGHHSRVLTERFSHDGAALVWRNS
jgi:hypothetical protein